MIKDSTSSFTKRTNLKFTGTGISVTDDSANDSTIITVNNNLSTIIDKIYPIGHILMTENSANPSTYLEVGTWVAYGSGRVPVGIDSTQTEFNTIGKTGGEKAHKLTVSEMPSHNHQYPAHYSESQGWMNGQVQMTDRGQEAVNSVGNAGGDQAHNNLQPYIVCYMWKRTA
jgi:hypothetical protein